MNSFKKKRGVVHGSYKMEQNLLKRPIVFVNRRLNVVKKIVIPRTKATATYILSELEELAREEFSRLKKVKEKKRGKKKHDHEEGHFCPICSKRSEKGFEADKGFDAESYPAYILVAKETEPPEETSLPPATLPPSALPPPILPPSLPSTPVPQVASSYTTPVATASTPQSSSNVASRLNFIKQRLTDIITITKNFVEAGIDSFDVKEFITICEGAKNKIETFFETESPLDADLQNQLKNLKCNIRDVVNVTKDLKKEDLATSSIDRFIKACEMIDSKLNQQRQEPFTEKSKDKIKELTAHIDDVMQMTQDYTSEGLLTPGIEEFIKSCSIIKAKIEGKPVTLGKQDIDEEKLDHLKEHIDELKELTGIIEEKIITSSSIEKFISACNSFKTKIKEDKEKLQTKKAMTELSQHIEGTVGVGKEAQKEGLLGDSVEDFIKSIDDAQKRLKTEGKSVATDTVKEPTVLDALKSQINNIIKSATKIKSTNLISASIDNLLKSCEKARAKIDVYQRFPPGEFEKREIYPNCSESCICERDRLSTEQCEKCKQMGNTIPHFGDEAAPCGSCQDTVKGTTPSQESVCGICSGAYEEDILLPELTPDLTPEESEYCEICEMLKEKEKEKEREAEKELKEPPPPPPVDSSLGYFEKKVRKITKVTRTQNPDGTIREEKETITVRQEKHDPNETSLVDDDENEEYDVSYDSLEDNDGKRVAVCSTPNLNQQGFLFHNNKAKSEIVFRASPMGAPILKECISYDGFNIHDCSIEKDSVSTELDFWSLLSDNRIVPNN